MGNRFEKGQIMRIDPRLHGDWAIEVLPQDRIVMIKGKGGWNYETALAYTSEFKQKVTCLLGQPWVSIGYGVDWELGVPETEPVIHELYEWMVANGCLKQITIALNPISKAQLAKYIEVKSASYTVDLVPNIDAVMQALGDLGFEQPEGQFDRFIKQPFG